MYAVKRLPDGTIRRRKVVEMVDCSRCGIEVPEYQAVCDDFHDSFDFDTGKNYSDSTWLCLECAD